MKILMICRLCPPGGIKTHILNLVGKLRKLNYDVNVLSISDGPEGYHKLNGLNLAGYHDILLDKNQLFKKIEELKPDIIHIHQTIGSIDLLIKEIKRKFKLPLISTIHIIPQKGRLIDTLIYYYFKFITRKLKYADRVICVSNAVREGLLSLYPRLRNKTTVIMNGIDVRLFKPSKKISPNKLIFVGRLSPEKGIGCLLAAFQELSKNNNNLKLYIIGSGVLSPLCQIYATLNKNVKYLGYVSNNELVAHLSTSNLAIIPSTYQEAFGLVILEAQACGTPVVAFKVGGIPEIIEDGKTGFIARDISSKSLADTIAFALRKDIFKMRKACRSNALKYKWDKVAKETEQVYLGALKKKS